MATPHGFDTETYSIILDILNHIPDYHIGTKKGDMRKIKAILQEYDFDEDLIQSLTPEFCQGFDAARSIFAEACKQKYWNTKGETL